MNDNWTTNDKKAARALHSIDAAFNRMRSTARNMKLADKVQAYGAADAYRKAAYEAVARGWHIFPGRDAGRFNVQNIGTQYTRGGLGGFTLEAAINATKDQTVSN